MSYRKLSPEMYLPEGTLVGEITGMIEDSDLLTSLGVQFSRFKEDEDNSDKLGTFGEFRGCVVTPEAHNELDKYWGRFIWTLRPADNIEQDEEQEGV